MRRKAKKSIGTDVKGYSEEINIIVFSLLSPTEWHAAHLPLERSRKFNLFDVASVRRTKDPLDE